MVRHNIREKRFDPDAKYRITVNRVVPVGGPGTAIFMTPMSAQIICDGAYAETISDAIETWEKVS